MKTNGPQSQKFRQTDTAAPNGPSSNGDEGRPTTSSESLTLPSSVAGSGTIDRLVDTARDYARAAASDNTLKAYAKDWA
ncbi:MAG: hypothetical protein ABJ201_22345, partial [Nisaea sp.]